MFPIIMLYIDILLALQISVNKLEMELQSKTTSPIVYYNKGL